MGETWSIGAILVIMYLNMFFVENDPVWSSNSEVYHCDSHESERSYIFTPTTVRSIGSLKRLGAQRKLSVRYGRHSDDASKAHPDENDLKLILKLGRNKIVFRMEKVAREKFPLSCRQSALVYPHVIHSLSYIVINITIPVNTMSELLLSQSDISSSHPRKGGPNLKNNTMSKVKLGIAKPTNKSADFFDMPDGKDFPHFPSWSKVFSINHIFNQPSNDQGHPGNILVWYKMNIACTLLLFLAMFQMCLWRRDEFKKVEDDTIVLRLFTCSFFLKWHWNRLQSGDRPSISGKINGRCMDQQNMEQTSLKPFHKQISVIDLLSQYVFRPWHLESGVGSTVSCPEHCKSNDCSYINDSMCSSCHHHFNNFPNPNLTIHVNPVTSFLPYPTYNPDLDFAHVGYRLATFGSFPSSVPVSRVKLADAGFYFRGQNDEVMCYSCHIRYSDWSRGGDPMDIHRQLSPHCEHVLHRDQELAVLASGDSRGTNTNATNNDIGQRSAVNGTPEGDHVEDSEHTETRTRESLSVTSKIASSPLRPAVPTLNSPAGQSISTATVAQTDGRVLHEYSSHAATNLTEANYSANKRGHLETSTSARAMNDGLTETRNAQSAGTNSVNSCSSTNTSTTISYSNSSAIATTSPTDARTGTTETRSLPGVPNTRTSSANPSTSADNSSARGGTQHLFPQARLDLSGAVYPMYQNMTSRRRSFTIPWDDSRAPPLDEVILCGMFYGGYADCVRCFYCGVGLKNWVVTDNVWTEHVRWRPECGYLRAIKGDDFIRNIQRRLGIESPGSEDNQQMAQGAGPASPNSQNCLSQNTTNTTASTSTSARVTQPTSRTTTTSTSSPNSSAGIATATTSSTSSSLFSSSRLAPSATATTPSTSSSLFSSSRLAPSGSESTVMTSRAGQSARVGMVASTSSSPSELSAASSTMQAEGRSEGGGGEGGGARVAESPNTPAERERLAQLREENRQLSQRLRCRACRRANIDTILMPCGHLVLCSACASTVTSCPLCQSTIRATAHVYLDN